MAEARRTPASVDDQQATIAFLSRRDSHGVEEPVERIDTHAAIVFLAGKHAWKLKRAVRYPYLDFSTVEKRKRVCEAELRLNRRTAPQLYLDVRSVNRLADGSLGFGEGEPVDWLVVMRRFESDSLLEAVATRGELDSVLVRELADHIAEFHEGAQVHAGGDGAARLLGVIEGNRESMAALPEGILSPADCKQLHQSSLSELSRLSGLLDQRAEHGHVRHCHGDMHLANICVWEGQPTLFDCLEFDEELATTDVLYDLAFLLMDLWEKGYRTQASLVFNRYLDRRDELDGIAAMPLFLSVRAAVRAHVSATAAERQESPENRSAKVRAARAYLAAAQSFLRPSQPCLTAVGGLSGTGKSTLSALLAPKIGGAPGARWLRSDVVRKSLAGVAPEVALPPDAYTPENSEAVYGKLMDDARKVLAAGHSVIVDAVFAREHEREEIARIAREAGIPFLGLWLEAPPATLVDRVTARRGDASDADGRVVERQLLYEIGDLKGWTRIESAGAPDVVLATVHRLFGKVP